MAAIVDEEASRLDSLIGEALEMAQIDANVVEVQAAPQHTRALLDQAVEESRDALVGHRVMIEVEDDDEPPGSMRTCWARCCATCWRTRRDTHQPTAASR